MQRNIMRWGIAALAGVLGIAAIGLLPQVGWAATPQSVTIKTISAGACTPSTLVNVTIDLYLTQQPTDRLL